VIFDSDVLIWVLRGNEKAAVLVKEDGARSMSVVSSMELLQGARDKREMAEIRRFIAGFEVVPVSEEIGFRALLYMELYALKTRLSPLDALIAAAAVERQEILCSGNEKHYGKIEGLRLQRFRP
jgi:hypothetical protein